MLTATRSGSVQMVRLLVSGGADVNWQQYTGSAALHLVAAEGRRDMLEVRVLYIKNILSPLSCFSVI